MRNELDIIQLIEKHLTGQLNEADLKIFEERLNTDPNLKQLVEEQQLLMQGAERHGLKQSAKKAFKKYKFIKNGTKWGLGSLGAIVVASGIFLLTTINSDSRNHNSNIGYELNETGEAVWADADSLIAPQLFDINTKADTLLETKEGMLIVVPKNAFLDENGHPVKGNIELEVKEAITPESIMQSGLSSMSGDQLLESGGMFYLNARKNGKTLKINPDNVVYVEVPADDEKEGMQVYDGKRQADGSIDWVAPKPLETFLTPVDITKSKFYPPMYLDAVGMAGYDNKDKKFTDSLYYSFASEFVETKDSVTTGYYNPVKWTIDGGGPVNTDGTTCVYFTAKIDEGYRLYFNSQYHHDSLEPIVPLSFRFSPFTETTLDHFKIVDQDPLQGYESNLDKTLTRRLNYYQNTAKFVTCIKLNEGVDEIQSLVEIEWMAGKSDGNSVFPSVIQKTTLTFYRSKKRTTTSLNDLTDDTSLGGAESSCEGINPAKIKAIWNDDFQNTLLASKEFRDRIEYIHLSCDNDILDLYVNNLGKRMATIDSIAIGYTNGKVQEKFVEFAQRNDGILENGNPYTKQLARYYKRRAKAITEAIAKTQTAFWSKQTELDKEASKKTVARSAEETKRKSENYKEEYDINLKDACKQLGIKKVPDRAERPDDPPPVYQAVIREPGWKNIDRVVAEQTAKRETIDYTDEVTGRKAVIKYEEITVTPKNATDYDKLFVYLLPDQLNSFMRAKRNNEEFKEKLNELMKYDLVVIGYKGNQAFYHHKKHVTPKMYNPKLNKVSKEQLNDVLAGLRKSEHAESMLKETEFRQFEIEEAKRKSKIANLQKLRAMIRYAVFPCQRITRTDADLLYGEETDIPESFIWDDF